MFTVAQILKATQGRLLSGKPSSFIQGISIDSRKIKEAEAFIAIKGDNFDGHSFISQTLKKGAACVICSEKKSALHQLKSRAAFIQVKDTVRALGDIARFNRERFSNIPLIGVTGSNGKTTTKEMTACLLSSKFKVLKNEGTKNNQIGLPLTLLSLNNEYELAVLELGTNHFGEIEYLTKICSPNVGLITNIGPSHLEFLHDKSGVFKEKCSLFRYLKSPYLGIVNSDDIFLRKLALSMGRKPFILSCALRHSADFFAADITNSDGRIGFYINAPGEFKKKRKKIAIKTMGYYNVYNALMAIAVARVFGVDYQDIRSKLENFEFPSGRLKLVEFSGLRIIDDTYNSNPLSLEQALASLKQFKNAGRKILIMGDMLELGGESSIFHYRAVKSAAKICDIFISVGELAGKAAGKAARYFTGKEVFACTSIKQARDVLASQVLPNEKDIILIKGSRAMKMEEIFKN